MEREIFAIIVAGGSGSRMGAGMPKQFLKLGGKTILRMTIEKFQSAIPGVRIVTVLPQDSIGYWKDLCMEENFTCPQIIVPGGITRFHSVRNALGRIPDGAVAAIHDGVRPLVSRDLLRTMVSKMDSCRALIPVVPSVDTLKAVREVTGPDGNKCLESIEGVRIDRSEVYCAQTPQIFLSEDIKAAYALPYSTEFTDDASVAEAKGIPLTWIPGERYNLKITTPEDLLFAEAILSR